MCCFCHEECSDLDVWCNIILEGKKYGGGKKFARLFRIVPSLSKKIFRRNFPKLLSTGGGSDYEKFLLDSIFPTKLTEFPTKLTEFVPLIFLISQYCPTVRRILPDWLRLPNKPVRTCGRFQSYFTHTEDRSTN